VAHPLLRPFLLRFNDARPSAEQLTGPCDVGGAIAVGEQPVVADAVEPLGQHCHVTGGNGR
jgi:hypothetical protein